MRKIVYTLLVGIVALLFTGCAKDTASDTEQQELTRFTVATEGSLTRSAVVPTRYIMEVLNETGSSYENVFDDGNGGTTYRSESTTGQFSAVLDKRKAYKCMFWADDGSTYTVSNLKDVTLNTGKQVTECYYLNTTVPMGRTEEISVKLKRAVGKITLEETNGLIAGETLQVRYEQFTSFDVLNESPSGMMSYNDYIKTIEPDKTKGIVAEFMLLAMKEKVLPTFTFTYNSEPAKTVNLVPIQQNFVTNIKGEFSAPITKSFMVAGTDIWDTPDFDGAYPDKKTVTVNGVDFKFVLVKAGTFQMGSKVGEDLKYGNETQHWVRISKDYYISETEVTQAQWKAIMGDNPSFNKTPVSPDLNTDDYPVEQVSWLQICSGTYYNPGNKMTTTVNKADCFLTKLGALANCEFNLPTEAQWEYATRGGHKPTAPAYMRYPGTDWDYNQYIWHNGNSTGKTRKVATKLPNNLGIYDMCGNVDELCFDFYTTYGVNGTETSPLVDPVGSLEEGRPVYRGGNHYTNYSDCRSASRYSSTSYMVDNRVYSSGFRLVLRP